MRKGSARNNASNIRSGGLGWVNGLKGLASHTLSRAYRLTRSPRVVVLCYHSIHPQNGFSSATPALFQDHLDWLEESCQIVRFADVPSLADGTSLMNSAVAITFDDGFKDNHTHALPALARHNMPAMFFVTTGFVDGDQAVIERVYRLPRGKDDVIRGMSWTQIRELRDAGMEIGSHTVNHPNLASMSDKAVRAEMTDSKRLIEDRLNESISCIAYPFGLPKRGFSRRTIELAAAAGYKRGALILYRNVRRSDSALAIPRIAVTNDSVDDLARKLSGAYDWLGAYQEHAPLWVQRTLDRPRVGSAKLVD